MSASALVHLLLLMVVVLAAGSIVGQFIARWSALRRIYSWPSLFFLAAIVLIAFALVRAWLSSPVHTGILACVLLFSIVKSRTRWSRLNNP